MRITRLLLVLPLIVAFALPAAADFKGGLDFFKKGDYGRAKAEFEALAKQGMAAAQTNLGLMYSKGYGVTRDESEAVRWYRLAAEQSQAQAQNNLGFMYVNGEGGPKDNVLGLMWLKLAVENGYSAAGRSVQILEKRMSKAEVTLAKRFAAMWKEKWALSKTKVSQNR
jgi:TPR repeat protein